MRYDTIEEFNVG